MRFTSPWACVLLTLPFLDGVLAGCRSARPSTTSLGSSSTVSSSTTSATITASSSITTASISTTTTSSSTTPAAALTTFALQVHSDNNSNGRLVTFAGSTSDLFLDGTGSTASFSIEDGTYYLKAQGSYVLGLKNVDYTGLFFATGALYDSVISTGLYTNVICNAQAPQIGNVLQCSISGSLTSWRYDGGEVSGVPSSPYVDLAKPSYSTSNNPLIELYVAAL